MLTIALTLSTIGPNAVCTSLTQPLFHRNAIFFQSRDLRRTASVNLAKTPIVTQASAINVPVQVVMEALWVNLSMDQQLVLDVIKKYPMKKLKNMVQHMEKDMVRGL